jgi:hypothetical protein
MTQESHHQPESKLPAEASALSQKVEHQISPSTDSDNPKFGRLLMILLVAVALVVAITFATEAYHSR